MITVRNLLEHGLPTGTQVIAGEAGLDDEVTWATRPAPSPPAFGHLRGGELVLLTAKALQSVDERLTLEGAIRELAATGVAAIAFAGRISAGARSAADAAMLPLLQLPADADLAMLEREMSHLIAERRREAHRQGLEAGRRLMELAIAGESLTVVATTLAEMARRSTVIEGRDGRILAIGGSEPVNPEQLAAWLDRGRPALALWLRTSAVASPAEPPTTTVDLDQHRKRVVAPIFGRDGLLGLLSLLLPGKQESPEDALLASRGAAACAVVLARERAAAAARQELALNVLDEILDGALQSEVSLLQQAKRLGHDLESPHAVIVARLDQRSGANAVRPRDGRWAVFEETLARHGARRLWRIRHNQVEIVWPATDAREASAAAQLLFDDARRRLPDSAGMDVSMGLGRVGSGLRGIRHSYHEAKQALTMGRRLYGPGRLTRFDDLGVYRLLFAAQDLPELRAFHDEALGPLIEYDRENGADLIRTLEAFFAARCGPKEAAALLGVHRNTVLYRLERIRELTRLDLDDADVRLRLHLALCAHAALFGQRE
ncbi:MAG: CdaR family transcriptional regulator [Thermomicrobiales bacterium]|nr:MAG: CdaR family transcriptional regulator [Thermomicrobiales bacterium]